MTDVYKLIANMICNSINGKWDKAIVEIESSLGRMLSTNAYYFYNNEEKHAFELIEDNQSEDLGENVFAMFLLFKNLCRLSINGTKQFTHLKRTVILI